jgi:hypothetical protein
LLLVSLMSGAMADAEALPVIEGNAITGTRDARYC